MYYTPHVIKSMMLPKYILTLFVSVDFVHVDHIKNIQANLTGISTKFRKRRKSQKAKQKEE